MRTSRLLGSIVLLSLVAVGCGDKPDAKPPVSDTPPPKPLVGVYPASANWDPARWADAPPAEREAMGIAKLAEPLVLDGELTEWGSALAVPSRSESLAIYSQGGHEWLGVADASQESFIAWNADGVCLATVVTDSEVFNDRPPEVPWDHDCASFTVQARPTDDDPDGEETPPTVWVLVVPPREDQPADVHVYPKDLAGAVEVSAVAVEGGYVIEALVPWSALEIAGAAAGMPLAARTNMIDYDLRDGEQVVPFALVWHRSWYQSPHRRPPGTGTEAVLVDQLARSRQADLESEVFLDVDTCPPASEGVLPISIDLGLTIGRGARAVELAIDDWAGRRVLTERLELASVDSAAGPVKGADCAWSLDDAPYGQYTLTATVLGADDAPLGYVYRDVLITRGFEQTALAAIDAADIPSLAADEPLATTEWLLAAANLERFRQRASRGDIPLAKAQARELMARLALLETGEVASAEDDLWDLLGLATDPEAQVVVEFYPDHVGHVNIYWGAVPLATVTVRLFPDATAAVAAFQDDPSRSAPNAEPLRETQWDDGRTQVELLVGRRIISTISVSAQLAKSAVFAVAQGEPISLPETDAMRSLLAEAIEEVPVEPLPLVPEDMKLFVGDVHMHTIFSDGSYSPLYMAIQSFCNGMDFSIITDHNDVVGAQLAQAHSLAYGFDHSVIVGDEITTAWAHLNGYPLRELVDWELAPYELVRSVHAQGAAIQWNHPSGESEWAQIGLAEGIGPLGVDAWEHVPPKYDQWRAEGRLPTLVGSTDEHMGYFFNLERSIILAPTQGGVDVADAVRRGNVCLIDPRLPNVVYGAPHMIARVKQALLEGTELRRRRIEYVRKVLAELDIVNLIQSSGQRKIMHDEAETIIQALHEHAHEETSP